jgi:hypothetical protein
MNTFAESVALLRGNRRVLYSGIAALVVLVVAAVAFFSAGGDPQQEAQKAAQKEAEALVLAVGKLMVLPDEQPVIATVADPTQLEDQPFFKNAAKGDKVLIYNAARKAILYRPDTNLIIDVAPLNVAPSASSSPTP